MTKIVILGSGVMGSAIAIPAARNACEIVLVGSPLDNELIDAMAGASRSHPGLGVPMPAAIELVKVADLSDTHFAGADVVLLGVSSPGLEWGLERICRHVQGRPTLMMVTKGLDLHDGRTTRTLPPLVDETLHRRLGAALPFVGVGGPCIAREVAEGQPTATVFGGTDPGIVDACRKMFQRPNYQVRTTGDLVGLEACAAIKNLMAIGIAASWSANPPRQGADPGRRNMNPAAGCFQQAFTEMAELCQWLGGEKETAYGLPGLGDLFVTVNAGRNSRLGLEIGAGLRVSQAMAGALAGETVEGVDTGHKLAVGLAHAFSCGDLDEATFPLTGALLTSIVDDVPFEIQTRSFWT
ncbi:Glycerol-3-phosphate dehydrogenase [NAD(P)+] [hydrothermal vent metagenome]|uniref:Glycerol-3-phosphate dehydrogenase [NAD(P)+] n=1 Tax=hydrothermal vent metagenome TaxID=652676 RepID=A0A3B0SXU7_9ZZZZ